LHQVSEQAAARDVATRTRRACDLEELAAVGPSKRRGQEIKQQGIEPHRGYTFFARAANECCDARVFGGKRTPAQCRQLVVAAPLVVQCGIGPFVGLFDETCGE
jgi:hypothetical protein